MSLLICFVWVSVIDICCFLANTTSYELRVNAPLDRENERVSRTASNSHEIIKTFQDVKCHAVIVGGVMTGRR